MLLAADFEILCRDAFLSHGSIFGKNDRHCMGHLSAFTTPWKHAAAWRRVAGPLIVVADPDGLPPILAGKDYAAASVFTPQNLLREARRQKGLAAVPVP